MCLKRQLLLAVFNAKICYLQMKSRRSTRPNDTQGFSVTQKSSGSFTQVTTATMTSAWLQEMREALTIRNKLQCLGAQTRLNMRIGLSLGS